MCGNNTNNAVDNRVNIMLNPLYDETIANIDFGVTGKQVFVIYDRNTLCFTTWTKLAKQSAGRTYWRFKCLRLCSVVREKIKFEVLTRLSLR